MFNDLNVWLALALAFILGWLTDWLLEILYWRGRRLQPDTRPWQQRLASQEARVRELEQALAAQRASVPDDDARLAQLAQELRAAQAELAEARARLARQAEELDRLRVAQAPAVTAEAEPPSAPAGPEAAPPSIKTESAEEPAGEPLSAPSAQAPAVGHRLDDEARRIAALLAGRPYEPPPATTQEEVAAAPAEPPTAPSPDASASGAPSVYSEGAETEPRAGSEAASLRKQPRSRRGSK